VNYVYLSPHFPPNFRSFSIQLNRLGATVLGLGDCPFEDLTPELKQSLTEYFRVSDMHNYDELLRALGYYTHRYGKLDRLESHSEYWLQTEASLRTDFNIPGIKADQIERIKRKSLMKKVFEKAGVGCARGKVCNTLSEAVRFVRLVGYPIVAKPDVGVGAASTYKIKDAHGLESFYQGKPAVDYILEEFVEGDLYSFDGLVNQDGTPVFYTSHKFSQGIMETVNEDRHIYYYSLREIPWDLVEAGTRLLEAFDVRQRFFHFEFFRTPNQRLVALEVNMRPPGGLTTDMFNYANDIDVYREYANVVLHNRFEAQFTRPYHCCYVGRKNTKTYAHDHHEALAHLRGALVHHEPIMGIFSAAIGNYGYLVRSEDLGEIGRHVSYLLELQK